MTLLEQQQCFTRNVGLLIGFAYAYGYALTFGEAYRTPEQAALNAKSGKGIANSLHCDRLAVDLNLFKDGQLLCGAYGYSALAQYWLTLHSGNRWGGNFTTCDYGHYSMEFGGRQ